MSDSLRQRLIVPAFAGLIITNLCFATTTIHFLESRDSLASDLTKCTEAAMNCFPGQHDYVAGLEKENKHLRRRLKRCKKVLDHFSDLYEE